ncbi:DUF559 domain-containing protein [Nocardia yamanashiensis]|uniref:DUF559 domain-containing protein n=1 Tax=Nocardia yamanashiensis TaxID=209247 RepID=UPI001E3D2637|nr:DUF559 domain-containing protein [Nocardia yamanashiensis]UGT42008.1 DUF559 domain-containing protein [Nocardia yamanashiensis]
MIRTRAQLLADGIPPSTIEKRCRRGTYIRLLPGIYTTQPPTTFTKCHAVMAWLPTAVFSHSTAAWLLGMQPEPSRLEATVPKATRRTTPPWLRLNRRDLHPVWVDELSEIPITTPALTLLDCVHSLPKPQADTLIDENLGRTVRRSSLLELCNSGLRGSPALTKQLREAALNYASEPERRFARALHERNLHLLPNHQIGRYYADFADERSRTIIEIDGRTFHSSPAVFRQDRHRQNALLIAGWLILRYAATDIFHSLNTCADEAAAVIRTRRRTRRPK